MATASPESMVRIESLGEGLAKLRLCEPQALRQMEQSLAQLGQICAITVFSPLPGALEVVDGFKRLRAARSLGWQELRAHRLASTAAEAKLAIVAMNASRGLSELEEAWLVRSLYREDRLTQPEIARRLRRDKSWVCRRLMLAESLDEVVQADVRLGLLSASAATALARLPRRNQGATARVATSRGLTCRELSRLVEELLGVPEGEQQARTLEQWLAAPPAGRAWRPARRARSTSEWLAADVATLARVGARLQARLLAEPLAVLGTPAAQLAREGLASLLAILSALTRTIAHVTAEEDAHAELEHTRAAPPPSGHAQHPGPLAPRHRTGALGQPQHGP